MRVLTPHTTHCRRKFAYRLFELVGDDRFFPGPRVETQLVRDMVALQNASASVGSACCTKPSSARRNPEHINDANPP